ncbi:hypothetical protein RB614_07330 [Phytohabitans sp. ZYX-F-186]|uniref:FXSXX-COOH protein n=1 Tax=Phytohabitans maris TaxID=3071409 RepID=A0ABU0ZBB7_9ACTN|nr:hypothetical protein [Phytohabitans sp. ZYX-F-186]MDQ7904333.1 hypothetical protein [Phytohabitans sp. ZYX-F-186]
MNDTESDILSEVLDLRGVAIMDLVALEDSVLAASVRQVFGGGPVDEEFVSPFTSAI